MCRLSQIQPPQQYIEAHDSATHMHIQYMRKHTCSCTLCIVSRKRRRSGVDELTEPALITPTIQGNIQLYALLMRGKFGLSPKSEFPLSKKEKENVQRKRDSQIDTQRDRQTNKEQDRPLQK